VWIDVTVPIENGMAVWPGDPETRIERFHSIARGDGENISTVSMCLHAGTHMDAPLHYFEQGIAIDQLPLDAVIGPARVLNLADLPGCDIHPGDRLLLKTPAPHQPSHPTDAPAPPTHEHTNPLYARAPQSRDRQGAVRPAPTSLTPDAAKYLIDHRIQLVGIDALSIGPPNEEGDEVHRLLLAAGIWIIERLDLAAVAPGDYDLICLPLRIPGADGAPARAALRPR
jgi:arylformamidase